MMRPLSRQWRDWLIWCLLSVPGPPLSPLLYWFILRYESVPFWPWIASNLLGIFVNVIVLYYGLTSIFIFFMELIADSSFISLFLICSLLFSNIAVCQCLILRLYIPKCKLWFLASAFGWLPYPLFIWVLFGLFSINIIEIWPFHPLWLLVFASPIHGSLLGAVFIWFQRKPGHAQQLDLLQGRSTRWGPLLFRLIGVNVIFTFLLSSVMVRPFIEGLMSAKVEREIELAEIRQCAVDAPLWCPDLASTEAQGNATRVILVLGHIDHGRHPLAATLSKYPSFVGLPQASNPKELPYSPETSVCNLGLDASLFEFDTKTHRYVLLVPVNHSSSTIKLILVRGALVDEAILVIYAGDGITPIVSKQLAIARAAGITLVAVYLTGADQVDDEELLEMIVLEIQSLLTHYGFPSQDIPIIRGIRRVSLEADLSEADKASLRELVAELDRKKRITSSKAESPNLTQGNDVVPRTSEGQMPEGRPMSGKLRVGDESEVIGDFGMQRGFHTGLIRSGSAVEEETASDSLIVKLDRVKSGEFIGPEPLVTPDSNSLRKQFSAFLYVFANERGLGPLIISDGSHYEFHFQYGFQRWGTMAIATDESIWWPYVFPGEFRQIHVTLNSPAVADKGSRFTINQGQCIIGVGMVSTSDEERTVENPTAALP